MIIEIKDEKKIIIKFSWLKSNKAYAIVIITIATKRIEIILNFRKIYLDKNENTPDVRTDLRFNGLTRKSVFVLRQFKSEELFKVVKEAGTFKMLDQQVNGLPFWEHGVKFFTFEGPNKEKIEFCEKL